MQLAVTEADLPLINFSNFLYKGFLVSPSGKDGSETWQRTRSHFLYLYHMSLATLPHSQQSIYGTQSHIFSKHLTRKGFLTNRENRNLVQVLGKTLSLDVRAWCNTLRMHTILPSEEI